PGRVLLQNESSRERCEGVAGLRRRHGDGLYSHPRRVLLLRGAGVGCRRSTRPGCEGAFPGGTTSSSVEERGLAPPRSTIRLPHCAGSCCSRGSVWASVLLSRMALARFSMIR